MQQGNHQATRLYGASVVYEVLPYGGTASYANRSRMHDIFCLFLKVTGWVARIKKTQVRSANIEQHRSAKAEPTQCAKILLDLWAIGTAFGFQKCQALTQSKAQNYSIVYFMLDGYRDLLLYIAWNGDRRRMPP